MRTICRPIALFPPMLYSGLRMEAQLYLEPRKVVNDTLELAANLVIPQQEPLRLWWRLPASCADAVTTSADPFVRGSSLSRRELTRQVRERVNSSTSNHAVVQSAMVKE